MSNMKGGSRVLVATAAFRNEPFQTTSTSQSEAPVKPRSQLAARMVWWTRFVRDRRGVSAIEFAIIAPMMILIYVGVAESGNALTVFRRTATVAMTASDLTAQVKKVSTADLKESSPPRAASSPVDSRAAQDCHFQRGCRSEQ